MTQDLGKILSATRRRQRLSIEDVAKGTKMSPEIINKIEKAQLSKLENVIYVKSFITLYADFLGINVDEHMKSIGGKSARNKKNLPINLETTDDYPYQTSISNTTEIQSKNHKIPVLIWILLIVAIICIGLAFHLYTNPDNFLNKHLANKKIEQNNKKVEQLYSKEIAQEEKENTEKISQNAHQNMQINGPFLHLPSKIYAQTQNGNKDNQQSVSPLPNSTKKQKAQEMIDNFPESIDQSELTIKKALPPEILEQTNDNSYNNPQNQSQTPETRQRQIPNPRDYSPATQNKAPANRLYKAKAHQQSPDSLPHPNNANNQSQAPKVFKARRYNSD